MKINHAIKIMTALMVSAAAQTRAANDTYLNWTNASGNDEWSMTSANWGSPSAAGDFVWDGTSAAYFDSASGGANITISGSIILGKNGPDDNNALKFTGADALFTISGGIIKIDDAADPGGDHNIRAHQTASVTINSEIISNSKVRFFADWQESKLTLTGGLTVSDNREVQIGWFGGGEIIFNGGNYSTGGNLLRTQKWTLTGDTNVYVGGELNGMNGMTTVSGPNVVLSIGGGVDGNKLAQSNDGGGLTLISGTVIYRQDGVSVLMANDIGGDQGANPKTSALTINSGYFESLGDKGIVMVNTNQGGDKAYRAGHARYMQTGGVVKAKGFNFAFGQYTADSSVDAEAYIVGGVMYLGGKGIQLNSDQNAGSGLTTSQALFYVSGGTLGAYDNWTANADIKLSVYDSAEFKTADENGGNYNITIAGAITGSGVITKTGGGTLMLEGANTYAGDYLISAGTVFVQNGGALNFILDGAGNNTFTVGAGAIAYLKDTINIDTAAATGASFTLFSSGVVYDTGFAIADWTKNDTLWTSGDGLWTFDELSGMVALAVIPEPSTWALLLSGAALLALISSGAKRFGVR